MLHKLALAVKTKTIEFFGEEEDEDNVDLEPPPEVGIITGQRVVVLKPDAPLPRPDHPDFLLPSVFAAIAAFRSAHLQLQAAHAPSFDASAALVADRAAVSHLRRLSELKRVYFEKPSPNPSVPIPSRLAAEVQENQSLLRAFEVALDRLQPEIDRRDVEAVHLRDLLDSIENSCRRLERLLEHSSSPPPDEKVDALLTIGVFDSVLRDTCRDAHHFVRSLLELMKKTSTADLDSIADSIHPGVNFSKPGHRWYAFLSYVFSTMFGGFESRNYGTEKSFNCTDEKVSRRSSLWQFIEHSAVDALALLKTNPDCEFSIFCNQKYQKLICKPMSLPFFLKLSDPLCKPFVTMASSVWMLHKLAWSYNPAIKIFQIERGSEFSVVYMESIVKRDLAPKVKVGFTVVPGFHVGKTIVQCKVYLDGSK